MRKTNACTNAVVEKRFNTSYAESLLKTIYPRQPMNGLNGKQKRTEIAGVSQFLSGCSGGFLTRIHIEITVNL